MDDWPASALCAQTDPDAFDPEKGHSTRLAKTICNACEVRPPCLDWAMGLEAGQVVRMRVGVLGGLSTIERVALEATGWLPGDSTPDIRIKRERAA
jgi:WhiB family transcriptional regulator, redox-sensing transcriptional regulator